MFSEIEVIKKIRHQMKKKKCGYTELSEKTEITKATLKRCFNRWSTQSLTLKELEKIATALNMESEENFYETYFSLPVESQEILKKLMNILRK